MSKIPFRKYHGFGNDYIVLTTTEVAGITDLATFAQRICDRHTGAGSDGIALLDSQGTGDFDFSCRIINPDGSEAAFSGNGTRCAVAHLYESGLWTKDTLHLRTTSGVKTYEFLRNVDGAYWFTAELGKPIFETDQIPFRRILGGDAELDFGGDMLRMEGESYPYLPLNVGNPVCVIFVESFELNWREIGNAIESHPSFPERTNVVFVSPRDEASVDIRIWERGAGETTSSGTCSVAAAVASAFTERTIREVKVYAPGGMTEVFWRADDEMLITGSAEFVYSGKWPLNE